MADVVMEDGYRSKEFEGKPSELDPVRALGAVTFDCETSALSPDDGGVSVVSVAWWEGAAGVAAGGQAWHAAWAFAQGRYGKPEDAGVRTLFEQGDDAEADSEINLGRSEWDALVGWLGEAGVGLDAHNFKFDAAHVARGVMRRPNHADETRRGGWAGARLDERLLLDTALACREVWPLRTAALKPLASELWGADAAEEQRALKKYLGPATDPRYDLVPWDILKPYAAKDAILTLRLVDLLRTLLDEGQGSWADVKREQAVSLGLLEMELAGVPYPVVASRKVAEELESRARIAAAQLPFTIKEAPAYYFGRTDGGPVKTRALDGQWHQGLGLEPISLTPTGRVQFTADTLLRLEKDGAKWAHELAEIKKAQTAQDMWYNGFADKTASDGRLRCMFRQTTNARGGDGGTASGRFSVERVNLQAIPHDYRLTGSLLAGLRSPRGLIAEAVNELEGWSLWELDLAQAELRVGAREAKCDTMLEMISAGQDLHTFTTEALFGLSKGDHRFDEMRQVGKRGNFSLIFGSGWVTFQGMVRRECGVFLEAREARRVVYEWNDLYPEFGQAIEEWSRYADRFGRVPLVNGRQRWFRPDEQTHKAFNQVIQASLAEFGKEWLVSTRRYLSGTEVGREVARRAKADGIGLAGLILVIHDSQCLLLPDDLAEQVRGDVKRRGEAIWAKWWPGLPGLIDVKEWK